MLSTTHQKVFVPKPNKKYKGYLESEVLKNFDAYRGALMLIEIGG